MTFLEYAGRGKNAFWRYVLSLIVAVVVAVGAAVFAGLLMGFLVSQGRLPHDITEGLQDASRPYAFFSIIALTFAIMLVGVATGAVVVHGKRVGDLWGDWNWSAFVTAFVVWGIVVAGLAAIDWVMVPGSITRSTAPADLRLMALITGALVIQTFAEEYVFRGYLTQGLLLATKSKWIASIVSGAIFGLCHIPNGTAQAVFATAFGIVLSLVAIRSGGLAFGFGMHLVNNLFGAVIVVSADDIFHGTPGLFTQAGHSAMWWDTLVAAGSLVAVALWFTRRKAGRAAPGTVSSDAPTTDRALPSSGHHSG